MSQPTIASCVPTTLNRGDEPAYCVPWASYNYPNNPIPKPAAITPPSIPGGVTVTNLTATGFTVTWTASVGAIDYVVAWGSYVALVPVGTTYTFTGLPQATTNSLIVGAYNAGGSASSVPQNVTTGQANPTGVRAQNITNNSFICFWDYIPGITYTLTWGAYNGTVTGNGQGSFTGLPGQTSNNLIVTANGTAPSSPVAVLTAPDPPANVRVTRRGTTYLHIQWDYITMPGLIYNIVFGTYTGTVMPAGQDSGWNMLPQGYSGQVQVTATNATGSSSVPFGTQTLLTPINIDTGNQNQASGYSGFWLSPLVPGTFTVPADFDVHNNGTNVNPTQATVPSTFFTVNAGFDYSPANNGGLYALRFVSTQAPNNQGSGGGGDAWQNEIACYTTGNTSEFNTLTAFTSAVPWYLIPGDTITVWLLIAYGSWIYRTYNQYLDPTAMTAYWRIRFTYNPFSLT